MTTIRISSCTYRLDRIDLIKMGQSCVIELSSGETYEREWNNQKEEEECIAFYQKWVKYHNRDRISTFRGRDYLLANVFSIDMDEVTCIIYLDSGEICHISFIGDPELEADCKTFREEWREFHRSPK